MGTLCSSRLGTQSLSPCTRIPPQPSLPSQPRADSASPPAPGDSQGYAESQACRPPSPRYCYSSSAGCPTFFPRLSGLRCPTHASLPLARSVALRPHRLVRSGIARLSHFHSPTRSEVGWSRAPRFQSTRHRLLMPKAASRNAPCSASRLQTTLTREYCVTDTQNAWTRQSEKAIGGRQKRREGLPLRN